MQISTTTFEIEISEFLKNCVQLGDYFIFGLLFKKADKNIFLGDSNENFTGLSHKFKPQNVCIFLFALKSGIRKFQGKWCAHCSLDLSIIHKKSHFVGSEILHRLISHFL